MRMRSKINPINGAYYKYVAYSNVHYLYLMLTPIKYVLICIGCLLHYNTTFRGILVTLEKERC